MHASILFLLCLLTLSYACPGLFGMSSGGGCGCSAPAPSCGCGGRKKRSLPENKPEFFGIVSNDEDSLCNTPELKKIIKDNMHKSMIDSTKSLQNALEAQQLQRYVVNVFVYSVRADTAYCGARKFGHYCHAFAL